MIRPAFNSLRTLLVVLGLAAVTPALIMILFTAEADTLVWSVVVLALGWALVLLAAWVGYDVLFLRRVNTLVAATRRLSSGDLTTRSALQADDSELGQLARAFDDMAKSLQEQTAAVARQATHDPLTKLPNRRLLHDHLEQAIKLAQREKTSVALLVLDINDFKEINDTLSHRNGDLLLQQVGPRLRRVLRESDLISRLGGDEFAVLLPGTDAQHAAVVAQKVLDVFQEPFPLGEAIVSVGAGIGIAAYPAHGDSADQIIQRADVAMYVAKEAGNEYFIYTAERDHYHPDRLALISDLRRAIDHNQLFLQFQPKIDITAGRTTGVEALLRWQHPDRGLVPPDTFISLAEHAGLIKPLTLWILTTALGQCRTWQDAGVPLPVAVNLSARSLQDPGLVDQVAAILRHADVPAHCLELEITESVIMADPERGMEILTRLHDMGVRMSVDDFGTGHSSLAYLRRLPVQSIKIDRSFVGPMVTNPDDRVIVRSIIELAHTLGFKVVAEGVETKETLDHLTQLGCNEAQGYYISRPLAANALATWLAESAWPVGRPETNVHTKP